MNHTTIRRLALEAGFSLKPQANGTEDLHPYVYQFAADLLAAHDYQHSKAALLDQIADSVSSTPESGTSAPAKRQDGAAEYRAQRDRLLDSKANLRFHLRKHRIAHLSMAAELNNTLAELARCRFLLSENTPESISEADLILANLLGRGRHCEDNHGSYAALTALVSSQFSEVV